MNTFGGKKREQRSVDRWPGGTADTGPDHLRPTRIVSPSARAIRPVWRVLACVVGAVVCSGLPSEAHGQDDITIRIIEEPYRQPNAFLVPYFEGLLGRNLTVDGQAIEGNQIGLGIGTMSTRRANVLFRSNIAWRQVSVPEDPDSKFGTFEIHLGAQLHPLRPTLAIGNTAVRATCGALGGMGMFTDGPTTATVEANCGFSFSSGNDPGGIIVQMVWRPMEEIFGRYEDDTARVFAHAGGWSLRLGFLVAPGG